MVRSCVSWCRHLIYALVVLALIGCLSEIGLRVYDSATGQITRRDLYDRGLVCKSWSVHHSLKPSRTFAIRHPDGEGSIRVTLNGLGLRGSEPTVPKPAGVFRILCLGDELTLAQQTLENETFCSLLQQQLGQRLERRVEVLNAGVPEYCPLLSYLRMKHELLGLAPDLVVVNFDMGDVADDHHYRRLTAMSADGEPLSCANPALELARDPAKSDSAKSKSARKESVFLLPQWCRQTATSLWARHSDSEKSRSIDDPQGRYAWLEDEPPDWSTYIEQTLSPLVRLRDLAAGFGARVIVVAAPAPWQVSATAANGERVRDEAGVPQGVLYRSRRPFEIVGEYCRTHDLAFCDVSPTFQRTPQAERLFLTNAAALSPEGHALYAAQLTDFIEREFGRAGRPGVSPGPAPGNFSDLPESRFPQR